MTTPKAKLAGLSLIAALCAGFTLGLTAPAWAGFDEGVAAYHRGDYATALSEFRPLAEQGNARAQHALGLMYRKGHGVPQDDAEAFRWDRKAAEQGLASAQRNLGVMYISGQGVTTDFVQAYKVASRKAFVPLEPSPNFDRISAVPSLVMTMVKTALYFGIVGIILSHHRPNTVSALASPDPINAAITTTHARALNIEQSLSRNLSSPTSSTY